MANIMANTKNDLIIGLVQKELEAKAKLVPFVRDLSAYAVKGAKSIEVPKLDTFTVGNRPFGGTVAEQDLTDSTDVILLNQNAYIKWTEDHASIYQSSIEFRMEAAMRAASGHARYVDEQIITGALAGAYYDYETASAAPGPVDISRDAVLGMREAVACQNGDLDKMVLVVSCDQEHVLLGINEFTQQYSYGSANIPSGQIGRLYGMPVIMSNLMPNQQAMVIEKDGYGYALQRGPKLAEEKDIDLGTEGYKVAIDQLFGTGILQGEVGAAGPGQSPLIAKLNA